MLGTGYFLLVLAKQFPFCTVKFSQALWFNLSVDVYRSKTEEKYWLCCSVCCRLHPVWNQEDQGNLCSQTSCCAGAGTRAANTVCQCRRQSPFTHRVGKASVSKLEFPRSYAVSSQTGNLIQVRMHLYELRGAYTENKAELAYRDAKGSDLPGDVCQSLI